MKILNKEQIASVAGGYDCQCYGGGNVGGLGFPVKSKGMCMDKCCRLSDTLAYVFNKVEYDLCPRVPTRRNLGPVFDAIAAAEQANLNRHALLVRDFSNMQV